MTTEQIARKVFRFNSLDSEQQRAVIALVAYCLDNPDISAEAFHWNYFYTMKAAGIEDVPRWQELSAAERRGDERKLARIRELRPEWAGNS